MNIGDLYFSFRGDGARLQADAKVEGSKAGTAAGTGFAAGFKNSTTGANIGKGLVQGLGLAGALGIVNLTSKAVSTFTDILGDSITAAREDQVSVQELGTALRDNVRDWDGNTDAIERTIKARIALGFSDDEQRAGLATLVRATHDEVTALALEAGAMDIARARHVDLATATDAVAKAYAGNTKGLKSLIPGLKLGATNAETLANAFASVSDSAKDFAATDEGKVLVANAKVNEAMERFGYTVLPAVTDAMVGAADEAVALATALDFLQNGVGKTVDAQQEQVQSAIDLQKALAFLFPTYGTLADLEQQQLDASIAQAKQADEAADANIGAIERTRSAYGREGDAIEGSLDDMGTAAKDWRDDFKDSAGAVIRSAAKVVKALAADAKALIDGYYDPIETRAALHDTRLQLFADQEALRTAKTKEDARQARDDIVSDLDDEASALVDLGAAGKLTATDVQRFAKDARSQYGSMSKSAIADTEAIIRKLEVLAGMKPKVTITVAAHLTPAAKAAIQLITHHAAGTGPLEGDNYDTGGVVPGPVGKPRLAVVHGGEEVRTYKDRMAQIALPRYVAPAVAGTMALATAGGASGGDTIHVNLLDRTPVTSVTDVGDRLRLLERRGYLRRRKR